jgi:hypothetical protein
MASSRKKCSNPSDNSGTLENDEFIQILADFDESEFSDTDKSSESDFRDEENDVLLLDSGDDIVTCRLVRVMKIMGSSSDDWIY